VAVDLGTGDGGHVLAAATARPDRLIIGLDANAAAMVKASGHAARATGRGGLPNALFVVASAEALPPELDGVADEVTIHFPWGSMLRGLLRGDAQILAGISRIMRPGSAMSMLVSATPRDRRVGVAPIIGVSSLGALVEAYLDHGLTVRSIRPGTTADVVAAHSSWGKRLGAGASRQTWLIEATATEPRPIDPRRLGPDIVREVLGPLPSPRSSLVHKGSAPVEECAMRGDVLNDGRWRG
jgi:16S rRNA (adenine(1408)-N(1))-methyltransferase